MKLIDFHLFHYFLLNTNVMPLRDKFMMPITHISSYTSASKASDPDTSLIKMFHLFNTLSFLRVDSAVSAIHGFEKGILKNISIPDGLLWTVAFAKRDKLPIFTLNQKTKNQYNKFKNLSVQIFESNGDQL